MNPVEELADAWTMLVRPEVTALATVAVEVRSGQRPMRAAVDRDGHRHLLVPAAPGLAAPLDRLPLLGLTVGPFVFEGKNELHLDIECRDSAYAEQFARFSLDVVEAAQRADDQAVAALSVVEKWRRLFGVRPDFMGEQRRRGLFAELILLQELVGCGWGSAVGEVWRGPRRETHDFVVGEHAVEVKAVGGHSDHVTIHGLQQLAPPTGGCLTLCVAQVDEDPAGVSLWELAEQIRRSLERPSEFDLLLLGTGLSPAVPQVPYVASYWWIVDESSDLPRLVPSSLVKDVDQERITNVRYDIGVQAVRQAADGRSVTDFVKGLGR